MEKSKKIIFAAVILIAVNLAFKLPFIEKRLNLDERIWEKKGIEFVESVFAHNWKNTRLSTRPAVTIEWIAGINNLVYQNFGFDKHISLRIFNRAVFVIIWTIFSVFSFLLLNKVLGYKISFASSVLLAMYPGINNLDGVVWTDIMLMWTQLCSILCFIIYEKEQKKKFLYLSGIFFGFSLLTKIIAWVIPVMLFLAVFIQKRIDRLEIKNILAVALIGAAVFYILYPASWLNPFLIFDRATELELPGKNNISFSIFYYPYSLLYNDPALSIAFLVPIFFMIKDKIKISKKGVFSFGVFSFYLALLTAISYFKDSQVESISSPRYYLPVIPFLMIFFALSVYNFSENNKYKAVLHLLFLVAFSYLFNLVFNLYFIVINN